MKGNFLRLVMWTQSLQALPYPSAIWDHQNRAVRRLSTCRELRCHALIGGDVTEFYFCAGERGPMAEIRARRLDVKTLQRPNLPTLKCKAPASTDHGICRG